jgi:predicted ATPase/transcriptional regulator with XRE-family HTH domain
MLSYGEILPVSGIEAGSFGARLRQLRETAGLTQEELAAKAGVTAKGIAAIERGRRQRPYPNTVRALADALGLDERGRAALIGVQPSPAPTPAPARTIATNLPVPPTALLGRDHDRTTASTILLSEGTRLLTLTGTGGVGKTTLALTIARDVADRFADGVTFVALAPLTDPELVVPTIARACGLGSQSGRGVREILHAALRDRHLLLVLDNWEQVIDAAPEVASLLLACPHVIVLATSRAALRLRGEREYPVMPLSVPVLAQLPVAAQIAENPAVQLFVARAADVAPGFALTQLNAAALAAICRRLDGLPLALELAAARIRLLSPTELLARLDRALPLLTGGPRDLPDRQRTMERAIDWSYDLVAPAEAHLFRQLAPFVGGWDLDAVEAIGDTAEAIDDPLELLAALVEQALVVALPGFDAEGRYRMLEPVRQYALQRLIESGEESAARQRHAAHYFALVEEADAGLSGSEQVAWLDRLEREHDNLRAALAWSVQMAQAEQTLRAVGVLSRFWWTRGYVEEGRSWMEQSLALPGAALPAVRAEALNGAGNLAYTQGDYAAARRFHEQSLALRRELADQRGIAGSLNNLGLLASHAGDLTGARALYEEAIAINRAAGNRAWEAINLGNLAESLVRSGEPTQAHALLERARALFEEVGNAWGIAMSLYGLGDAARAVGAVEQARDFFVQSLERRRTVGDRRGLVQTLVGLGELDTQAGDYGAAQAALREALTIALAIADRQRLIACLEGFVHLLLARGETERAALADTTALAEREAIGAPRPPNVALALDRALTASGVTRDTAHRAADLEALIGMLLDEDPTLSVPEV